MTTVEYLCVRSKFPHDVRRGVNPEHEAQVFFEHGFCCARLSVLRELKRVGPQTLCADEPLGPCAFS
jgi:hypothetical protein